MRSLILVALIGLSAGAALSQTPSLLVPRGASPLLDADCGDYGDGVSESFLDAGQPASVSLKHDGSSLWVCVDAPLGSGVSRSIALHLDPQGDGGAAPQSADAALSVALESGVRSSRHGDEAGTGWSPRPGLDPHWSVAVQVGRARETAEFRVSITGLQAGNCGLPLRLAVEHADAFGPGPSGTWPAGATPAVPAGWRAAEADRAPCGCGGVFDALADAELRASQPGTNYGAADTLLVAQADDESRTLLRFDVTPSIPPGATVQAARLELPLRAALGTAPYTVEVRRVDGAWNEATVSWSSQPAAGAVYATRTSDLAAGILGIEVTPLAAAWANGGLVEPSLQLATPTVGTTLELDSREALGPDGPPRLRVLCAMPATEVPPDPGARDAAQQADFVRLTASSTEPVRFLTDEMTGGVHLASFALEVPPAVASDGASRARWFLGEYRDLLRTPDPAAEWQLVRRAEDDRHLFFRQRHAGIPVFPSGLVVHLEGRRVVGVAGRYAPVLALDPEPRLTAAQAEAIATAAMGASPQVFARTGLVVYAPALLDDAGRRPPRLAWAVRSEAEIALVDAASGAILERIPRDASWFDLRLMDGGDFGPYSPGYKCWLPLTVWFDEDGYNAGSPDAEGWAAWNAIQATDAYFWNTFERDSYDNFGGQVRMAIHVGTAASWGSQGFPQATSSSICDFLQFSGGTVEQDVVGHEYTHSVTRHEADLVYKYQPGALNESFSDVFGQFLDADDWTLGEGWPSNPPLRDMADPPSRGQPDHWSGYNSSLDFDNDGWPDDNGGVHRNSGIPNKAAYLVSAGGTHNGYLVQGIGQAKTQRIWYRVLTHYLTSSSGFLTARNAFVSAAQNYAKAKQYGFVAADVCSVRNAFAAVGLGSGDIDCDGTDDAVESDDDDDGVPDAKDNCPLQWNSGQLDTDKDGQGDTCDADDDGDGVPDASDNCPGVANPWQQDSFGGPKGNACDDADGDTVVDAKDNCPLHANKDQGNLDHDAPGDVCDWDKDGDALENLVDNCPLDANASQADADGDGVGNACDHCPGLASPDNGDPDGDGAGNPCDADDDGDGVLDGEDNCPLAANASQHDLDDDGIGLACDEDEQTALHAALFTGLHVPVHFELDIDPTAFPIPVGPHDGPAELLAGHQVQVTVSLAVPYFASIVSSEGQVLDTAGPGTGTMVLSFLPAVQGATVFGAPARGAAGPPADLLVPAPDQLRYALVVVPADPGNPPPGTHDLFVRTAEGSPAAWVSQVAADACAGNGAGGDGVVDPGEDVLLEVGAGQLASLSADTRATLATDTPGVTVTRAAASFGIVPGPGGARSAAPLPAFTVDAGVACGTPLELELAVDAGGASSVARRTLVVGGEFSARAADVPLAVPDTGTVLTGIAVARAGLVADADVTVWIAHPAVEALELTLIAPDRTRIPLALHRGPGADFAGTTFDDAAERGLDAFWPPNPCALRPEAPLGALNGLPATGLWQLEVVDTLDGSAGTIDAWSLRLVFDQPACGGCAQAVPGEVANLRWGGRDGLRLEWDAAPRAAWYAVHEGAIADLPKLLTAEPESCRRWQGVEASAAVEARPGAGEARWYLVVASNGAGHGSAGEATAGARQMEAIGECP